MQPNMDHPALALSKATDALIQASIMDDRVMVALYSEPLFTELLIVADDSERVTDGPGYQEAIEFWHGGLAGFRWTVRLVIR